jgi:hypothetical protein
MHQWHRGQAAYKPDQRTALRPLSDPDSESVVDPGDAEVMADPPGSELELGPELDPGPNPSMSAWPPAPELPPPSELPRRSESAESVRRPWRVRQGTCHARCSRRPCTATLAASRRATAQHVTQLTLQCRAEQCSYSTCREQSA